MCVIQKWLFTEPVFDSSRLWRGDQVIGKSERHRTRALEMAGRQYSTIFKTTIIILLGSEIFFVCFCEVVVLAKVTAGPWPTLTPRVFGACAVTGHKHSPSPGNDGDGPAADWSQPPPTGGGVAAAAAATAAAKAQLLELRSSRTQATRRRRRPTAAHRSSVGFTILLFTDDYHTTARVF